MTSSHTYCVYFTFYSGNKLPPFYIGSSSIERVKAGYHGTPKSKKYKDLWRLEIKQNPHLFRTHIIAIVPTDKLARAKECELQTKLNVVRSSMYVNMARATVNGFFGMTVSGEDHPNFGRKRSLITKQKLSLAHKGKLKHTEESKRRISEASSRRPRTIGENNPRYGKPRSAEDRCKISEGRKGMSFSTEHRQSLCNFTLELEREIVAKYEIMSAKNLMAEYGITKCGLYGILNRHQIQRKRFRNSHSHSNETPACAREFAVKPL